MGGRGWDVGEERGGEKWGSEDVIYDALEKSLKTMS